MSIKNGHRNLYCENYEMLYLKDMTNNFTFETIPFSFGLFTVTVRLHPYYLKVG